VASAAVVDAQLPAPSPYPGEESYPSWRRWLRDAARGLSAFSPLDRRAGAGGAPQQPSGGAIQPGPEIVAPAPAVEETAPTAAELAYAKNGRQYEEAEASARRGPPAHPAAGRTDPSTREYHG